jgi:hypothetical protein
MRCKNCNSEVRSSWKVCPECETKLPPPTKVNSGNIIKVLVAQHGDDLLFNQPSILLSYAGDKLKGDSPDTLEKIELAIFAKVPQELFLLKAEDEQKRLLGMNVILSKLTKKYNEQISYEILNSFADALGFKTLEKPKSAPVFVAPVVQTVQQPQPTQQRPSQQNRQNTSGGIIVEPKVNSLYPFAGQQWVVLKKENGKALLLRETVLDKTRAFHPTTPYPTWAKSDIRDYLNGDGKYRGNGFYDSFSQQDKARISPERIITNANPWYPEQSGGVPSNDYIFLLSLEEVCGHDDITYFGDSKANLSRKGSAGNNFWINDGNNNRRKAVFANGTASWWWLRSPGRTSTKSAYVLTDGHVYLTGYYVSAESGGVRPALWLNL